MERRSRSLGTKLQLRVRTYCRPWQLKATCGPSGQVCRKGYLLDQSLPSRCQQDALAYTVGCSGITSSTAAVIGVPTWLNFGWPIILQDPSVFCTGPVGFSWECARHPHPRGSQQLDGSSKLCSPCRDVVLLLFYCFPRFGQFCFLLGLSSLHRSGNPCVDSASC